MKTMLRVLGPAVILLLAALLVPPWSLGTSTGGDLTVGPITSADWPPPPPSPRVMVALNTPITDAILSELGSYGVIHGWIDRYQVVVMTPRNGDHSGIASLPFVDQVDTDQPRYLTEVGSWDRDIIDVTDVEETGVIGDPDSREVLETGAGVHVAVIDTGLASSWRDFIPENRVSTTLARSFMGGGNGPDNGGPINEFQSANQGTAWEQSTCSHGLAVTSHITGFTTIPGIIWTSSDSVPHFVDGVAPGAQVIPLKVFDENCIVTFTSRVIAALDYVTRLVENGAIGPTVINMSLGGPAPEALEERAINDAIAAGIIVVAAAGNEGERGMGWPGAYPQVISVGAVGWTKRFQPTGPSQAPNFLFWWTQDVNFDPDSHRRGDPAETVEAHVAGFSSRAIPLLGQQLDVLAPGIANISPFVIPNSTVMSNFNGTSFSAPLTSGVAALMLEKNPTLGQAQVEAILKLTALPMNPVDRREGVLNLALTSTGTITTVSVNPSWDTDCGGLACDPVGAGLIQADGALNRVPTPRR